MISRLRRALKHVHEPEIVYEPQIVNGIAVVDPYAFCKSCREILDKGERMFLEPQIKRSPRFEPVP